MEEISPSYFTTPHAFIYRLYCFKKTAHTTCAHSNYTTQFRNESFFYCLFGGLFLYVCVRVYGKKVEKSTQTSNYA